MSLKFASYQKIKFPHGIMFHHFHDFKHSKSQGSISAEQFDEILESLGNQNNILNADEFTQRLGESKLQQNDICITFDDGLLCQSEIAQPVLKSRDIKAFFFVPSSIFFGDCDLIEVFRVFRHNYFTHIDDFYAEFFQLTSNEHSENFKSAEIRFKNSNYLAEYHFYSANDKWFRYLRDESLSKEQFASLMHILMSEKNFNIEDTKKLVWMSEKILVDLLKDDHSIGLHSYSHPTSLHKLDEDNQTLEYQKNFNHLEKVLGLKPTSMSHPFGNYNEVTLEILRSMKIKIGFRDNVSIKVIRSNLEIPREDHSNILHEISQ